VFISGVPLYTTGLFGAGIRTYRQIRRDGRIIAIDCNLANESNAIDNITGGDVRIR